METLNVPAQKAMQIATKNEAIERLASLETMITGKVQWLEWARAEGLPYEGRVEKADNEFFDYALETTLIKSRFGLDG